jgi:GMP synthase (glutamine-hydrolysing)
LRAIALSATARWVREAGVYCEIHPFSRAAEAFAAAGAEGGHPLRRAGLGSGSGRPARARGGVPILATCYGQQTVAG